MTNITQKTIDGYSTQAVLYKALAHPMRLRILDILARREACVCHLTAALHRRQPYISQQLALLREANLVTDRRDGTIIYYRVRDEDLTEVLAHARKVLEMRNGTPRVFFDAVPDGPIPDCACPQCQAQQSLADVCCSNASKTDAARADTSWGGGRCW